MSTGRALVVVVIAGAALLLPPTDLAHASCVGHSLQVQPATAKPGQQVTISGQGWFVGCFDTNPDGRREPADSPELVVEQAGRQVVLGSVNADAQDYTFVFRARLPRDLDPGPARIVATGEGGEASAGLVLAGRAELPYTGGKPQEALALALLAAGAVLLRRRPA